MKKIHVPTKIVEDYVPKDFGGIRDEKTVCIVRYGGFGDILQVASILPLLKEQGYRVCVNVTERGENICYSDPNIDELLIQKTDQISIDRLTEYWEKMSPCFDKFIQLSESIEGSLLLVGDRVEKLNGKYITAEDVGTTEQDMEIVRTETQHVTGVSKENGGSGDPSPVTAYGTYIGMKASAKYKLRWSK